MMTKTIYGNSRFQEANLPTLDEDAVVDNIDEEYDQPAQASLRQRKDHRGLKSHQEMTVLRDPRAYTSAWSRESRR
ncbi:hypothetical protein ANCCAN_21218 [Ancylostoma caninum]|uniref:Uncharacterized protein n=1 Tax=Ancylostoma caninum TaxID=29170 RepID=A0A368FLA7_ANCCA|nr:hypothetical protein ANCCAN_21218 [Ancylostoma caninum]